MIKIVIGRGRDRRWEERAERGRHAHEQRRFIKQRIGIIR